MTDRLAPRYARYGLLASFVLVTVKELEDGDPTARPSGDDQHRLKRMREVLATAREGAVVGGDVSASPSGGQSRLARNPMEVPVKTTSAKLDDARVIKSVFPSAFDPADPAAFDEFVGRADRTLAELSSGGLASVGDRGFLDSSLTEFLERLATANRGAGLTTRRTTRRRVSLA